MYFAQLCIDTEILVYKPVSHLADIIFKSLRNHYDLLKYYTFFEVKTSLTALENLGGEKLVLSRDQHAIVVVYLYIYIGACAVACVLTSALTGFGQVRQSCKLVHTDVATVETDSQNQNLYKMMINF